MAARTCPHCGAFANFTPKAVWENIVGQSNYPFGAWACDACGMPIVGMRNPAEGTLMGDQFPSRVADPKFPDVPESIAQDANEAHRCFSVGAPRAAATMARRAIQAAAFDKGAPEGRPVVQVDWMADNGHITKQMAEVAHRIRLDGNAGAHPDKDGLSGIDEKAAEAVLEFLGTF